MTSISPSALRRRLGDGGEIALIDPRDPTDFESGHLLLSVNLPTARLAAEMARLVPRKATPVVLCDPDEVAAALLEGLGYGHVRLLDGGVAAWSAAGLELFLGTYCISNAFALFLERDGGIKRLTADELLAKRQRGEDPLVIDSRPLAEYHSATLPGARNLPLAELAVRFSGLDLPPDREVAFTCGGRARSVLGCALLAATGAVNPTSALYYGTAGWDLAGYALEAGATAVVAAPSGPTRPWQGRADIATRAASIMADGDSAERTRYLIDVRSWEEFRGGHLAGSRWVPGGELLGLTEDHMATRNAEVVLIDDDGRRAGLVASFLIAMGWPDVAVLEGGLAAAKAAGWPLEIPPESESEDAGNPDLPPGDPAAARARHAALGRIMVNREGLLDQLERDATLRFALP